MTDLMERNREGRRGGNGSANNVSASRRHRASGFKDGSEDESQNSRLHSKKEGLSSRKRRNCRSSNGESHQYHHPEERDESFDEGAAMAASEEDDDLPPPTVRRRSGKLKIHLKSHEDVNPIDIAVVPRKLRTAMSKRCNESTSPHYNENPRKFSTEFAVATATPSSTALKAARRMKPNNHKLRPDKLLKVSSSTISEQEAEVAQTLFGLATMFSLQATNSISETKQEPNSEMKMGAIQTMSPLSSAQRCSSPVAATAGSPSSNHTMGASGVSKRKCPHDSRSKDAGEALGGAHLTLTANQCLSASSLGMVAESANAEQFADTSPFQTEAGTSPPGEPLGLSMVASTAVSPSTSTNASLPSTLLPQTVNRPKNEDDTVQRTEYNNNEFIQKVPSTYDVENKASVTNSIDAIRVAEKDIGAIGSSVAKEKPAVENRLLQLPLAKSNCPGESEIDLMAPPKSGGEINDIVDSRKLDIKEEQEMHLVTVPASENSIADMKTSEQKDKTMDIQTFEQDNQIIGKIEHDRGKDRASEKAIEQMKHIRNQSDCLERKKQDVGKQPPRGMGKNVKAESRVQRGDRYASATTSMAIAATNVAGTALPLSMGLAGWPAGLPALGYYSPAAAAAVAAAWPSPAPLTGTSTVDESIKPLPHPFFQTRHWKRSATHVYITHFIESQQQLRKNPLWAAAFGANGYNLSIPMAPGGILGVSVGGALGPEVKGSGLGASPVSGRGYSVAKDKSSDPYVDVAEQKPLPRHQTQAAQQQIPQAGPSFVFPVTQSASASATSSDAGGGNAGVSEAILGRGSSASLSSSSVHVAPSDTESGPSNRGVASAAAVQAHLLHSVIQHNVFPLFSHRQFGPLFSGHPSPQQVAQYYSNPFFAPQLMRPLSPAKQSQSLSNLTSEMSVSQKQQYSQGCSFATSGSPQQALHSAGTSSLEQGTRKESVKVSGIPTAETKTSAPRNVYGQTSSVNFPSTVLAAGMPTFPADSQDISVSFVGKQASKMHQQAQTQLQSQHQATFKWQQQQQDVDTKSSVSSPVLQMNLKTADLYTSEPPSPISIQKSKGTDLLPAVTLGMASQGQAVLQTVCDSIRGVGQYQTIPDNLLVCGQSHKFSMPEGQHQQQQQQHHTQQTQRLGSVGIEDGKASIEECNYSSKHKPNQPHVSRVELEESLKKNASNAPGTPGSHMSMVAPSSQGTTSTSASAKQSYQSSKQKSYKPPSSLNQPSAPAVIDSTVPTFSERSAAHQATFTNMPSQQGLPFLGTLPTNQGVQQVGTLQQQVNISQQSSAGSPGSAISGSPAQPTLPSLARTPGQTVRSQQSTTNVVPMSRLPLDSSISSPGRTPLTPLSPVTKVSGSASAKNAISVKDSLSPKSSAGSTSGKKASISFQTNGTSVLGSSCLSQNAPIKPSQAQLIQNQYNIHQQHMTYPLFQQTVQSMDSLQHQQQPMVSQQYPLPSSQQQAVQLHKQSLTQQPPLQLRQHLFMQQNSQYFQTQSQLQAAHSQHATKQTKKQSGQMASQSQQLGNVPQQQMRVAPSASFGIATNADFPAALCLGTSGSIPRTVVSDGVAIAQATSAGPSTPTKLTTDINMASPCFQKSNNSGPTFLLSQCVPSNCVPSTPQQISIGYTISSPYENLLSQPMSIADTTQKVGDDKTATGN